MAKSKPQEDRQARFALEYAKDLNGTQAALRAGYAPKSAKVTASRLLSRANVRDAIEKLLAKAAAAAEMTVERTTKEIARIAFGDIRKLFDDANNLRSVTELSEEDAAMLAGVESFEEYSGRGDEREAIGMSRKVKARDKLKALELCMSILGMHKSGGLAEGGLVINIRDHLGKPLR